VIDFISGKTESTKCFNLSTPDGSSYSFEPS
jgi:hypothetical protein